MTFTPLSFAKRHIAFISLLVCLLPSLGAAGLDQYGGWTGLKGEKTGFFHIEKIKGRYWFVNPDGNVFYPVALSHMLSGETRTAAKTLFGDDKEAWILYGTENKEKRRFNLEI